MSDIAQGARTKLIINPGEIYRVGTAGVATVVRSYGEAPATTTITANTQTFGPYSVQTKLVVTANTRRTSITPMGANAQTIAAAVSGTLGVGNVLTAIPPTGVTVVSYQWTRDGASITNAIASTYSQVSADEGKAIGVNVAVVASVSAGVVPGPAPVAPAITSAPALTGGGVVGQAITLTPGTVTGTPAPTSTFSWRDAGGNELSTSASAFTPGAAGQVTVVQTAANGVGSPATRMSNTVTVAAAPLGKWLGAIPRNKYPRYVGASGRGRGVCSRYPAIIGSGNPKKLRYSFSNMSMSYTNSASLTRNAERPNTVPVTILECAIERIATSESRPVTFSGGQTSAVLGVDQVDLQTDDILPSLFGLTQFTKGDEYRIKVKATVPAATDGFPGSRNTSEGYDGASGGIKSWGFDPETQNLTAATTFGDFKNANGTSLQFNTFTLGFCPIVLGFYDDPSVKSFVCTGDSIWEGGPMSYNQYAMQNAAQGPYGMIEIAGSTMQQAQFVSLAENPNAGAMANTSLAHRTYFQYGTLGADELGSNNRGDTASLVAIWAAMKAAGLKKILRPYLTPYSSSSQTINSVSYSGTTVTALVQGKLPAVGSTITMNQVTPNDTYNGSYVVTGLVSGGFTYTVATAPTQTPTNPSGFWQDNWQSVENQVAAFPSTQDSFAAFLDASLASGKVDAICKLDSIRGTPGVLYYWKPLIPAPTSDGLHPSMIGGTVNGGSRLISVEWGQFLDAATVA